MSTHVLIIFLFFAIFFDCDTHFVIVCRVMKTKIVGREALEEVAACLQGGGVVAFPTETVYGLGACYDDVGAVREIFSIKGRPKDNPLIVHIADLAQVEGIAQEVPDLFFSLAKAFWPGPLTMVVPKNSSVVDEVSAGLSTVAIRMPRHPLALELLRKVQSPLVAPSANVSGRPSPTNSFDVAEDLMGKIPWILDGGECTFGIESTVLLVQEEGVLLLRLGAISQEDLQKVVDVPIQRGGKDALQASPGTRYRHYAPKTPLRLVFSEEKDSRYHRLPPISRENLYRILREGDRLQKEGLEVFCGRDIVEDEALMDRLQRAAQEEVWTS